MLLLLHFPTSAYFPQSRTHYYITNRGRSLVLALMHCSCNASASAAAPILEFRLLPPQDAPKAIFGVVYDRDRPIITQQAARRTTMPALLSLSI